MSFNQRLTVGGADSSFNGNLFVGGFINAEGFVERFVNVASSSGTYIADFNNGLIIYINAFSGSSTPTLSITNLPTVLNQSYVFTVVYSGLPTSTYFSALNINGTSVPVSSLVSLTAASSYYVHQFCIFFTDATNLENNFVVQNFNSSAPLSLVSPSVSGNLSVNGNINLTGGNIFQNGTLFSGGGTSGNSLSLSGNLFVGGDVSFNNRLTGNGDVSLNQRLFVGGDVSFGGNLVVHKTTASTSVGTGALVVAGGVGVAGNVYTGGVINTTLATASTSVSTGALTLTGTNAGIGVAGNVYTGGAVNVGSTAVSTGTGSGALIVAGGVGVAGDVYAGSFNTSGVINTTLATASTSVSTGALTLTGTNAGIGVAGNVYVGGNLYVTGSVVNPTLTGTPVAPTAAGGGAGSTQIATTAYVRGEINTLIGGALPALDTLNELAAALGNNASFSTTVTNLIALKSNIASPIFTGTVSTPALSVTNSTASSGTGSGALIVTGGVGVAGAVYTGDIVNVGSIAVSANSTSGALIVSGGAGIGGNVNVGGAVTSVSFNATSDYRIKHNVHFIIEDASFNVDVLKPVSYLNTQLGKPDIGFIAHEVQEHYPYLVNGAKDGESMQTLNYTGIIGILTKEVQELKKKVSYQETKTIEQEQRIQDLEKMVLDILANK